MPPKRSRKDGDPGKPPKKPRKDPGEPKPAPIPEFPDLPLIKAVSSTKPTYWVRNFDHDYGM